MQTDNTTALGVVNKNVMKKIKWMDMKYHWLRCRISQMQFKHYWAAGSTNLGDYFTKHHPTIYHQTTRGKYLTDISTLMELWNRQKGGYARTITSCSKGVLDRSGLPDATVDSKKALEARKLLSASDLHGNRRHCERTTQITAVDYKNALEARKLLIASDLHGDRSHSEERTHKCSHNSVDDEHCWP
jgi:hypothetical protein